MPRNIIIAITLLLSSIMIGFIAYLAIEDESLKLALIMVAIFDMLAATFFVAKAFRQK